MDKKYDLIIIGSGPAGHSAAFTAARNGLSAVVIERDPAMIGGVCLNEGCIPAKTLLYNANLYSSLKKNSKMFGIKQPFNIDIDALVEKSFQVQNQLKKGLNFMLKKYGIDLVIGTARIENATTVSITEPDGNEKALSASNILIAVGSRPGSLPDIPFDGVSIINSSHAIRPEKIPDRILIVGAGAIGVEFASFFNSLGSQVTLMEIAPSLLPFEDDQVTAKLASIFRKDGIDVVTEGVIKEIDLSDKPRVSARISAGGKEYSREFDLALIAVGRMPNTSGIGLESVSMKTDQKGFIEVDKNLMTSVSGIYAAGDVIKTPMLAHTASAEGEYTAQVVSGQRPQPIEYDNIPGAVYSGIEVASVGLTEKECKDKDLEYIAAKQFFLSNGRAAASDSSEGFIKIIVSKTDRSILGAHIIGSKATELIHEFVLAKKNGIKIEGIASTVHAHPTFSETVMEACRAIKILP